MPHNGHTWQKRKKKNSLVTVHFGQTRGRWDGRISQLAKDGITGLETRYVPTVYEAVSVVEPTQIY